MSIPVITPQQMYDAEQRVFDAGVDSFDLMQIAGEAVARALDAHFPTGDVRVLCGPGGNGGDGFVAAAWLTGRGRSVRVYSITPRDSLKGDAAKAAALWAGEIGPLEAALEDDAPITLDALFGGGLSRPLEGAAAQLAETSAGVTVSIDVPSGLDGLTAQPLGACFKANLTVTFAALRPAHVLGPGRESCGEVIVADIGVSVPDDVQLTDKWPAPDENIVKYTSVEDLDCEDPAKRFDASNLIQLAAAIAAEREAPVMFDGDDKIRAWPDGKVRILRSADD